MATVLWSNKLVNGVVESDSSDKYALYKHADKLDGICNKLGTDRFSSMIDNTDLLYNLDQISLPDGMESTDQLMAIQGRWVTADKALEILKALLNYIVKDRTRFGTLKNDHATVIEELEEAIAFCSSGTF